ncbi:hypothetical protein LTR37_002448 [Vermiconidia calcicola]|uniref:Uncharacterized protein n=1 Tax=Vermiconidia calcicola TaxID=1690605 RepID=A0ACC3NSS2_9PEZI|nr:hypothetical protein LTR37_002448 [Vermiconidia calcicola]
MADDLDGLFLQAHRDTILRREHQYLSKHTNVEVFETGLNGSRRQLMNDETFVSYLKGKQKLLPEEPQYRIIFIPDEIKDTDKLQLSKNAFQLLLTQFDICSRFAILIHMQRQPCRRLEYDAQTKALARVQYVYSAILRSLGCAEAPKDPTKRLIDWRRLIVWTSRDMCTGQTTMVVLRCPNETQERLINVMSTGGDYQRQMLRHPMLVHAFFAEDVYTSSMDFSREFAAPMYGLELDIGRSAAEYTQRARRFMLMARQMGNVMIDYDIYLASLKLLQEISLLMRESRPPIGIDHAEWHQLHQDFDGKMFEHVYADIDLLKRYGQLYEQRTIIGNSEVRTRQLFITGELQLT